jgi:hypothetical protein
LDTTLSDASDDDQTVHAVRLPFEEELWLFLMKVSAFAALT